MKHSFTFYRITGISLLTAVTLLAVSCGNDSAPLTPIPRPQGPQIFTEVDKACASDIFFYGRPITFRDLENSGQAKYTLESVYFRDVISRSANDVELAYLVEMNMRQEGRALVPERTIKCREQRNPSRRAIRMSRTTLPILGDLHLPSTRITVFDTDERDRLYNFPRISNFSVSSDNNYFSFTQNPAAYRSMRTLSSYLELLRYRSLFPRVELREMGYGRIGIYAEKDFSGERAQLLIVLVERH